MPTRFPFLLSRLAIFGLLIGSLGCQKNDSSVAEPKTIADQILEDKQFSLLQSAITYAGVGDALKAANLTLFAPNDAAFQASGLTTTAAITALSKDQVKNILLYHVLYSPVSSSAVPSGLNSLQTANQGVAYINKTSSGQIYLNNAKVTQADIQTANGVVHIIDRVLTPSTGTLLATIQNNPKLTLLSAAVSRVASSNPSLLAALNSSSSATTFTVFAPNDDAFIAAGYKTTAALDAVSPQTLTSLLSYHVISGVSLAYQLQAGSLSTLLTGSKLTIAVTNGTATVKGNKNPTAASIKSADLITTNGIIHIIDQVLQP